MAGPLEVHLVAYGAGEDEVVTCQDEMQKIWNIHEYTDWYVDNCKSRCYIIISDI